MKQDVEDATLEEKLERRHGALRLPMLLMVGQLLVVFGGGAWWAFGVESKVDQQIALNNLQFQRLNEILTDEMHRRADADDAMKLLVHEETKERYTSRDARQDFALRDLEIRGNARLLDDQRDALIEIRKAVAQMVTDLALLVMQSHPPEAGLGLERERLRLLNEAAPEPMY